MKSDESINDQTNENDTNSKLKSLYNVAKSLWMLNYGMTKFSHHHMNSVLVEAWGAFNISDENIIGYIFAKKKILSLIPPDLTTNTQACAASVQLSSGDKAEEINNIWRQTVAPSELQGPMTDDPIVVLREKGEQQSSRSIILQDAAYEAVKKITVIHIQYMKKECDE